jgi:DNA-directed RNA polymerase I, II, and III subunit RPABC1
MESESQRATRHVEAMLARRGYAPAGDGLFALDGRLCVFLRADKLSVHSARDAASSASARGAATLLAVVGAAPTAPVRLAIAELERVTGLSFEVFTVAEMQIDVLGHELQPSFRVVPEPEVRALLAQRRVKLTQLPRMLSSDPCARYLGARRGTVLCITRRPESANELVTYRVVT